MWRWPHALGIGGDLTHWSEEELREGAALVAEYKQVRHLVQHGRLDRLSPPAEDAVSVVQYTAADASETLLLVYRRVSRHGAPQIPVRLRGLHPGGATATPAPVPCTTPPCSASTGCTSNCPWATGPAPRCTWYGSRRRSPSQRPWARSALSASTAPSVSPIVV